MKSQLTQKNMLCHSRAGGNPDLDSRLRGNDKLPLLFTKGFARTKKIISIAVILIIIATSVVIFPSLTKANWFGAGGATGTWNYRQKITIDRTKVADTDGSKGETDFPVLISVTNVTFKSIANGGHVGLDTGYDIVFTSGDGKTKLAHEIEKYVPTTGELIAWVKVPKVTSDVNTTLYMYYGNAAETGNEQNATGVWDSNYKGVWHLADSAANKTVTDSKGIVNMTNVANTNAKTTTGQIDGALNFVATSGDYATSTLSNLNFPITISGFFKNNNSAATVIFSYNSTPTTNNGWRVSNTSATNLRFTFGNVASYDFSNLGTSSNDWYYFAVTITGNSGTATGYLAKVGSSLNSQQVNIGNMSGTPAVAMLGGSYTGAGFTGTLDEIHLSSSLRTADWIRTEYNNQSSPSTFATFGGEETQPTAQVKGAWFNSSWSYRKKLTIDKTKVSTVSGTTNTNFPVLVSMTDASLKSIANGGHMASTTATTANDLVFTDSSGTVKLNHEIEKYDPATGQIIAWVQLPTLAPAADTDIYLYYGNASVSTSQENKTAVWDANYKGVWHMNESSGTIYDSTSNHRDATPSASAPAYGQTGKIGSALDFERDSTQNATMTSPNTLNQAVWTIEAWIDWDNYNTALSNFYGESGSGGNYITIGKKPYSTVLEPIVYKSYSGIDVDGTGDVTTPGFHHVVLVKNASNDWAIYLDGVLDKSITTNVDTVSSAANSRIGSGGTDNAYWDGLIDEMKVSHTNRTPDWIVTEYANQSDQTIGSGHFYKALGAEQVVPNSNWFGAWGYRKKVIINHTQVSGTSTLAAFPVLVSVSADTLLRSTANGGHMASTTAADLLFTDLSGTKIPHEIEKYDPATGQLIVWVKTNVSPTTDTILYMYYGNPNVTVSQEDKTGVWSNGYAGVWHLPDGTSLSANDSLGANNLTSTQGSPTAIGGQVDGGMGGLVHTSNISKYTSSLTGLPLGTDDRTACGWVYPTTGSGGGTNLASYGAASTNNGFWFGKNGNNFTPRAGFYANNYDATSGSMTQNAWNYLCVVVYSSATKMDFYLAGSKIGNTVTISNANTLTGGVWIGNSFGDYTAGGGINGSADEVKISNIARSASWIATEYNNQSAPTSFVTLAGEESSIKTTVNTTWYSSDYGYRKKITIDHRKVSGSTALTDFPVLISLTDAQLKSTGNGGLVASTTAGDILFTDSTGKNKLAYEIESYNPTTGNLIAWVKISSLSPSSDTAVYLYFGNSVVTTMQANPTGVWDSNYAGVWHFPDGATLGLNDSTSNLNNGTAVNSPLATTGTVDGALQLRRTSGVDNYVTMPISSSLNITGKLISLEFWVKRVNSTPSQSSGTIFWNSGSGSNKGYKFTLNNTATNTFEMRIAGISTNDLGSMPLDNNWHHVAIVQDSSTQQAYVDGILSNGTATAGTISAYTGAVLPSFGPVNASNINSVNYDEMRLSATNRTADWIKTEYNNQSAPGKFYGVGALEVENRAAGKASVATANRGVGNWTGQTGAWTNRRQISVNYNKVSHTATTTLYSFPMLFSTTNNEFKTVANGGKMGKSDGTDLFFTASDGTTKLAHEIESYNASTGQVIAWVNIPILTKGTYIYMYYGNASADDMQTVAPVKTAVWDSSYKGVWHMGEASGTIYDSTSNDRDATPAAASPTYGQVGKIGLALDFEKDSSQYTTITSPNTLAQAVWTIEAWIDWDNYDGGVSYFYGEKGSSGDYITFGKNGATSKLLRTIIYKDFAGVVMNGVGDMTTAGFHHVVLVKNANNDWRMYLDGNLDKSDTTTLVADPTAVGANIGSYNDSAGSWDGLLDEMRVSHTNRSVDWIKTEYNNQSSPSTFYTLGPSNPSVRPANTPLLKSRGGVQLR